MIGFEQMVRTSLIWAVAFSAAASFARANPFENSNLEIPETEIDRLVDMVHRDQGLTRAPSLVGLHYSTGVLPRTAGGNRTKPMSGLQSAYGLLATRH